MMRPKTWPEPTVDAPHGGGGLTCWHCGGEVIPDEEGHAFMHAAHGERVGADAPGDWRGPWCNRAGTGVERCETVGLLLQAVARTRRL